MTGDAVPVVNLGQQFCGHAHRAAQLVIPATQRRRLVQPGKRRVRRVDYARASHLPMDERIEMPDQIDALYFTGGSTGLRTLVQAIAQDFPQAQVVRGERFASVATGLGVHARRLFGSQPQV
jgi:hypothetical chaperone protein